MFWAPCVRVDVPIDAPAREVHWVAAALDPIIAVIEDSEVTLLNLAMSAAALRAFDRHGLRPLIDRIAALAGERRIELISTAAHGALLPLLPPEEIGRQIDLNDEINRTYFGDGYTPTCLWSPALAVSLKVADVAGRRDYSTLLVDEGAMRVWPGHWDGKRIDYIEGMPGMFLVPSSRGASAAVTNGRVRNRKELEALAPDRTPGAKCYLVTTANITPRSSAYRALLIGMDREPTLRLEQLFNHFPLAHAISPLPCSELSQPEELGRGLPFAPWFCPGNERQSMQWRLMTMLVDTLHGLEKRGLTAVPGVQVLREMIDRSWRADWWHDPAAFEEGMVRIRTSVESVQRYLPEDQALAISSLTASIGSMETSAERPLTTMVQ